MPLYFTLFFIILTKINFSIFIRGCLGGRIPLSEGHERDGQHQLHSLQSGTLARSGKIWSNPISRRFRPVRRIENRLPSVFGRKAVLSRTVFGGKGVFSFLFRTVSKVRVPSPEIGASSQHFVRGRRRQHGVRSSAQQVLGRHQNKKLILQVCCQIDCLKKM